MKNTIKQELIPQIDKIQAVGKWKTYEVYKGSGFKWLGKIPEHWNIKRIKYIITEPLTYGANESAESTDPTQPRYVRITDINERGGLREETFRSLPENIAKPYILRYGDLLFARSGATVGKSFLYQTSWGRACYAGYLIRFRMNMNIISPFFLSYFVNSSYYKIWLDSVYIQATIQNVSAEKYANLKVPFPSLAEQQTIISFLDRETTKINSLIVKREHMIELLQEQRTAIINQVVTKGLNPAVKMRDSEVRWFGKIPEHWEIRRLKYVAGFLGGGTPSKTNVDYWNGEIPWVSPKDMKFDIIIDTEDHISQSALKESSTNIIQPGAVLLVVRSGILRHSIPVAINQVQVTINQDIKAIMPDKKLLPNYLAAIINSHQEVMLMQWRKSGATVESIEYDLLINTQIPIPPFAEQEVIVNFIHNKIAPIDKLITGIKQSIQKLKEYEEALISAAVTGKIDVQGEVDAINAQSAENMAD